MFQIERGNCVRTKCSHSLYKVSEVSTVYKMYHTQRTEMQGEGKKYTKNALTHTTSDNQ